MNMMKYCPECYKELPPNSVVCPFCGYKTGNGDAEGQDSPGFLKTPQTDSYLPPEQTVLSLLLMFIVFWGINISVALLPIYLDFGSLRNVLISGITAQVITRALIGFWAFQEASLNKDVTTNQKLGAFLLALIPVADIPSFLQASRTIIRKNWFSQITISTISAAIILSILLYGTRVGITALSTGGAKLAPPEPTLDPDVAALYDNGDGSGESSEPSTPTPRTFIGGCRNPQSVTDAEEGDILQVCGEVTNYGDIECESCPLGFYSFIKLDHTFQIVSYDWRFTFAWLGDCMRVSDQVELLGEDPVFVFSKGEGYAGTECTTDARGELVCDGGFYFQDYFSCGDRH